MFADGVLSGTTWHVMDKPGFLAGIFTLRRLACGVNSSTVAQTSTLPLSIRVAENMSLPSSVGRAASAACDLVKSLPADAVFLLTETPIDWDEVSRMLTGCKLLRRRRKPGTHQTAARKPRLDRHRPRSRTASDPGADERGSPQGRFRRVTATRSAHIVALYNGIASSDGRRPRTGRQPQRHSPRRTPRAHDAQDLRVLGDAAPIDVLRAVVDLATEIGREGAKGQPIGTILVVGDTRKVLSMSHFQNFNPFRGYSRAERDVRKRDVREQIKEIAKLDGAILIGRDGIAGSGLPTPERAAARVWSMRKGFGSRHMAAAGISKQTNAIAFAVSQSSG